MGKAHSQLIMLLPLFFSMALNAGEIRGIIRDSETNSPVAGALVSAVSAALPSGSNVLTEDDGRYVFQNLPAGTYTINANYAGAVSEQTVTLLDEQTLEINLNVALSAARAETYTIETTGTRLPTAAGKAVSPVTSVGETDIKETGSTRIENAVNQLPQAFATQGASVSNGSNGTAQANLRGLGASRTLILIDGRRLGPGNPNSFAPVVGDLNFIPAPLVDRIDVLTGGASAIYGADAVAGVVNFVTKKDFQGVQLDLGWSGYQHNNTNTAVQNLVKEMNFQLPANSVWNLMGPEASLIIGVNSPDKKGNVTAYGSYRKDVEMIQADRDFSACTLNSGDEFSCGGSGTSHPARVGSFTVQGDTFRPRVAATDVYNFGPLNHYLRPDERYNLGAFAHYEFAPWLDVYSQAMYLDDRTYAQIAPGGIFASSRRINCDNPLLTPAQRAQICPNLGQEFFTGTVAKRNVEGGGRQSSFNHSSYRYVAGVRGNPFDSWNYDAFMQYQSTDSAETTENFFHSDRIDRALDVVVDPTTGQPACRSFVDGSDTACVPYNIFQEGKVTPEALKYLQVPGYSGGWGYERVVNASLVGDLGDYGIRIPSAKDGIGVGVGGEWRNQAVKYYSDFLLEAGLLSGTGGASPPIDKDFHVGEFFSELRIPFVQDVPALKNLSAELAYRYSRYSFNKDTHTYKAGGIWEFLDGMRVRGSYQRAVRAPSLGELYAPRTVGLDGATDPCALQGVANPDPTLLANCRAAFPGFDPLAIEANPAAQYNGLFGGKPDLDPELADTYSVGFALQPTFVPGLQVSMDYFNISIDKAIGGVGADIILAGCIASADPNSELCKLVVRDAQGSLFLSPQGYVTDTNLNLGAFRTSGIDVFVGYDVDTKDWGADMGRLFFSFNGTWLDTLITQPVATVPAYDCTGLYGAICFAPSPEWRHKMRASWETPIGVGVSAQWRYMTGVNLDTSSPQPSLNNPDAVFATDLALPSRSYFDVSASYSIKDVFTVRAGVNNVLDTDPPLVGQDSCPTGPCNGNTYPQVYDALGRYFFINGSVHFQ